MFQAVPIKKTLGKREFLKSYVVLLRAELNCNNKASQMGQAGGADQVTTREANLQF